MGELTEQPWGTRPNLNTAQIDAYLVHLRLDPHRIRAHSEAGRDYALLALLQNKHYLAVPFDTTAIHIPEGERAQDPEVGALVKFGAGPGVALGLDGLLDRFVRQKKGSYCFGLNVMYSALLRGLGFRVIEMAGRVNSNGRGYPEETAYHWGETGHLTLAVDTSDGRYLSDVAWPRGGFDFPIEFAHNATADSMLEKGAIQLRHDPLPNGDISTFGEAKAWTLWSKAHAKETNKEFWQPCYCFADTPVCPIDLEMMNYYNWSHPVANFMKTLYLSKLLPDGRRQTFLYTAEMGSQARYMERGGGSKVDETINNDLATVTNELREKFGWSQVCG